MKVVVHYQPAEVVAGNANSGGYVKNIALGVTILFLLAANVHLNFQLSRMRIDISKARRSMQSEIDSLRESAAASATTGKRDLEILKNELERARRQANRALSETRKVIVARAEELARRLAEEQQQVATELNDVKRAAITADAKISNVTGEVRNVKTAVDSAKNELQMTVSDLRRVNGDLGFHGRLIATNASELSILRRLGDRNYFEFTIDNSKEPHYVADIGLLLKKSDPAKNLYTVQVFADDKSSEKKDKTVNEPVQFYVSRLRQPYELVVNEVKKNQIIGYLAIPKLRSDQLQR